MKNIFKKVKNKNGKIRTKKSKDNKIKLKSKKNKLKDKSTKKLIKNKKLFVIFSLYVVVLLIVILISFGILNRFNFKILKDGFNKENITIDIGNVKNNLKLWDITINDLKSKNNSLIINIDNMKILLDSNRIIKNTNLNVNATYQKSTYDFIKDVDSYTIDFSNSNILEVFKNIEFSIKKDFIKNKNIDIYLVNSDELLIPYKTVEVVDNKVSIDWTKEFSNLDIKKIVFVYVPLNEITVANENIIINKNSSFNLETKLLPINCTNRNIKYSSQDESIAVVSDTGVVTSVAKGQTKINITVDNENLKKEINVTVNEVATSINVSKNAITLEEGKTSKIIATVEPSDAINKELVWTSLDESVAKVNSDGLITAVSEGKCDIEVKTKDEPIVSAKISVTVNKKSNEYSNTNNVTEPTYIKGILIVNKKYALPSTYNPGNNPTALAAFNNMKAEASKSGLTLFILSGFRSYQSQVGLYNRYVSRYGVQIADTFSARPGHSEHQTGLTFDVNSVEDSFAYTAEGKWLAANCHRFGFIIRYPKGKESITGYQYEPWHIRYVGVDVATSIYNSGICLEEYLGI